MGKVQSPVTPCHKKQLYMTYSKSLMGNGLLHESTKRLIKSQAAELSVSEEDVIVAWLNEMGRLHE